MGRAVPGLWAGPRAWQTAPPAGGAVAIRDVPAGVRSVVVVVSRADSVGDSPVAGVRGQLQVLCIGHPPGTHPPGQGCGITGPGLRCGAGLPAAGGDEWGKRGAQVAVVLLGQVDLVVDAFDGEPVRGDVPLGVSRCRALSLPLMR